MVGKDEVTGSNPVISSRNQSEMAGFFVVLGRISQEWARHPAFLLTSILPGRVLSVFPSVFSPFDPFKSPVPQAFSGFSKISFPVSFQPVGRGDGKGGVGMRLRRIFSSNSISFWMRLHILCIIEQASGAFRQARIHLQNASAFLLCFFCAGHTVEQLLRVRRCNALAAFARKRRMEAARQRTFAGKGCRMRRIRLGKRIQPVCAEGAARRFLETFLIDPPQTGRFKNAIFIPKWQKYHSVSIIKVQFEKNKNRNMAIFVIFVTEKRSLRTI